MTWISDRSLDRLRDSLKTPDLSGTRYRLVRKLSEGGMGAIYLAHDTELDREVALKVVAAAESDDDASDRLLREARILARLEHPGIVPVHDAGKLADGRVFYVMKRVRGRTLDASRDPSSPIPERLRLVESLCDAIAFAHSQGILHRDLKPENIMIGPFGEALVMDWGLALMGAAGGSAAAPESPAGAGAPADVGAPADAGAPADGGVPADGEAPADVEAPARESRTLAGTVLGTPGYMAPEQAAGDVHGISGRTDVYGLGGILYFLLTGRAPSPARTASEARAAFEAQRAPDFGGTDAGVTRPLEAICAKALSPDPADRYATPLDLARDLRRFEARLPVGAYRETLVERLVRWAGRYRTPLLLILAYLFIRVILIFTSSR